MPYVHLSSVERDEIAQTRRHYNDDIHRIRGKIVSFVQSDEYVTLN